MTPKKPRLFYGYIVVVAAFFIMTTAWGSNRTFGIFLEPMLDEFGWTRAGISGAFTLSMIVMGCLGILTGRMTDRFGPRVVAIVCGLFLGSGYLLSSQVGDMWQLYLFYGLIAGIGMSGAFAPLMSVVARWFVKRRALMCGIISAGPAIGIVILPPVFTLLISAHGWRNSFLILGSVILIIFILAALFLKRDPGEIGLLPYGADTAKLGGIDLQTQGLSLEEAIRTRQFWLLGIVAACDAFLINLVVVHIVIHVIGLGIPATAAASVLSVAAGISIPSRVVMGAFADKIGNRSALMISLFVSLVAFILLLVARDLWMLYLFAVLYGIGLWATGAIVSPLTADLFGLKAHGSIFAGTGLAMAIGSAVGPVVAGRIFDVTGSYQLAFVLAIAVCIISVICLTMLKPAIKR